MKWIEILRKGNYALLQSESDTQYVVASGYDPMQPEDQKWSSGIYFTYWDEARKEVVYKQHLIVSEVEQNQIIFHVADQKNL